MNARARSYYRGADAMLNRVFGFSFGLITCILSVAHAEDKPDSGKIETALRDELKKRVKEDQDARFAMLKSTQRSQQTDPGKAKQQDDARLANKVNETDAANTKWLKEVVAKHGWPGKSLVGAAGAHDAWLLVQHADRDREFQKKCLELMKPLAANGEVSKTDFAYLTDRVLVGDGKKQIYGTQFHTVDGKLQPQPIEDEANVDQRRKEVGLMLMAEYRKLIEQMYQKKQ